MSFHEWTLDDLQYWDEAIQEKVAGFGLRPYDIEFRIYDWEQMCDFHAYGMPYHYRHWSFGLAFEKKRTMQVHGMSHVALESVVSTDPAIAVLFHDNNLVEQILVMAHVYGHSDFHRNNVAFQKLVPSRRVLDTCKMHAQEIDEMYNDPSIRSDRVEELLTAAHALLLHRPYHLEYKRETREAQVDRVAGHYRERTRPHEWDLLKPKSEREEPLPDFDKVPLEPDYDLLRFLAEYAPLQDWEKRILEIVAWNSDRYCAHVLTRVMNEGWATYWHDRILRSLSGMPAGWEIEYAKSMAGVARPTMHTINPYHLGSHIWKDIFRKWETPDEDEIRDCKLVGGQGQEQLFRVRRSEMDSTFVSGYVPDRLIAELGLYSYTFAAGSAGDPDVYTVQDVPDKEGYEKIRQALFYETGLNMHPVIRVLDANWYGDRTLVLQHTHDGRDLTLFEPDVGVREILKGTKLGPSSHTLHHIWQIWRGPVELHTIYDCHIAMVKCDRDGKVTNKIADGPCPSCGRTM